MHESEGPLSVHVHTRLCGDRIMSLLVTDADQASPAGWVFPEVKKLYTFAASFDVHVDFVWYSRTHKSLQYADELSRIPDSSELFLRYKQFTIVEQR